MYYKGRAKIHYFCFSIYFQDITVNKLDVTLNHPNTILHFGLVKAALITFLYCFSNQAIAKKKGDHHMVITPNKSEYIKCYLILKLPTIPLSLRAISCNCSALAFTSPLPLDISSAELFTKVMSSAISVATAELWLTFSFTS